MTVTRLIFLTGVLAIVAACNAPTEDWSDPAWIDMRLEALDPRAFQEFASLPAEQQGELVPTIVEVYNGGLRQEDALRALVAAADPAAKEVFLSALERADDSLAALGARGLAAIDDTASATAVAQRLSTVTQHEAYPAFLDSLKSIPTPQAADVVAELLFRPAPRIGGINTVRSGCSMLSLVENPSQQVMDALAFSLVNFIPQPFTDALNECELALIEHGDRSVPALLRMMNGEDQRVNTHLRSIQYPDSVGQLRGGAVLAHLASPAAVQALVTWFNTEKALPEELLRMELTEQQQWYEQQGQLFTMAVEGLAIAQTPETVQTLRGLERIEGEGALLGNFQGWLGLSNGAEFGMRTAVHEALSQVGSNDDREMLWERAESGNVSRGGRAFTREIRANALHFVGRTARPDELARYEAVVEAQDDAGAFLAHRAYFVLAQQCGEDAACYNARVSDASPVLEDESIAALVAQQPEGQARDIFVASVAANASSGALWQLALRLGEAGKVLEHLDHDSTQMRFNVGKALLVTPTLPANTAEAIQAFIDGEENVTSGAARDIRHAYRLVTAIRAR